MRSVVDFNKQNYMIQISTNNLILLKAYNEITESGCVELDSRLEQGVEDKEECVQIMEMKNILDGAYEDPNPTSIQLIMEESMRSQLEMH
jgi:hypothetical protein